MMMLYIEIASNLPSSAKLAEVQPRLTKAKAAMKGLCAQLLKADQRTVVVHMREGKYFLASSQSLGFYSSSQQSQPFCIQAIIKSSVN
ncbi:hypothetical protein T07_13981 [Trichinella nelsoni]|uniref:Uncharacterized protein n=1 Tax=Trichinella nelsoni TaxID=6336 RepID=A0A0V0SBA9_9BILA|nr:hypothetical protein T07_13981 [Trichinella nelsoni]